MPLIPILGRQKQVDLWEFKASLVWSTRASSKTGFKVTEKPCLKKPKNQKTNKKKKVFCLFVFCFFARPGGECLSIPALRRQRQVSFKD